MTVEVKLAFANPAACKLLGYIGPKFGSSKRLPAHRQNLQASLMTFLEQDQSLLRLIECSLQGIMTGSLPPSSTQTPQPVFEHFMPPGLCNVACSSKTADLQYTGVAAFPLAFCLPAQIGEEPLVQRVSPALLLEFDIGCTSVVSAIPTGRGMSAWQLAMSFGPPTKGPSSGGFGMAASSQAAPLAPAVLTQRLVQRHYQMLAEAPACISLFDTDGCCLFQVRLGTC